MLLIQLLLIFAAYAVIMFVVHMVRMSVIKKRNEKFAAWAEKVSSDSESDDDSMSSRKEKRYSYYFTPTGEKRLDIRATNMNNEEDLTDEEIAAETQRLIKEQWRPIEEVLAEQAKKEQATSQKSEPESEKRLKQLKEHLDSGLITKEEYKIKRREIRKDS